MDETPRSPDTEDAPHEQPVADSKPHTSAIYPVPANATVPDKEIEPTVEEPPTTGPGKNWKKIALISLAVLLNLGIAGASAEILRTQPIKPKTIAGGAVTVANTAAAAPKADTTLTTQSTTEHYTSTALNTEFDYPVNWHISSDAADKTISITSPLVSFDQASGGPVKGRLSIDIDNASSDSFILSSADTIINNSQSLTYANPTALQRKTTNLSFANDSGSANTSGIDYMFVSGSYAYTTGATVGSKNYQSVQPFITLSIDSCDGRCEGPSITEISYSTYQTNQTIQDGLSIIKSMRFTK